MSMLADCRKRRDGPETWPGHPDDRPAIAEDPEVLARPENRGARNEFLPTRSSAAPMQPGKSSTG
jgi:hypothetical protein